MKLSAPKQVTWWVAVVVGALGFIGNFVALPLVSPFWFLFIGFALLALATFMDGL